MIIVFTKYNFILYYFSDLCYLFVLNNCCRFHFHLRFFGGKLHFYITKIQMRYCHNFSVIVVRKHFTFQCGGGGGGGSDKAPDLIKPNLTKCYVDSLKIFVIQDGRYRRTFLNIGFCGNIN